VTANKNGILKTCDHKATAVFSNCHHDIVVLNSGHNSTIAEYNGVIAVEKSSMLNVIVRYFEHK
jgi:hypothetical protein